MGQTSEIRSIFLFLFSEKKTKNNIWHHTKINVSHSRCLTKNSNAVIEIELSRPICIELYKDYKDLGRFMLRYSGSTIAAGLVTEVSVLSTLQYIFYSILNIFSLKVV